MSKTTVCASILRLFNINWCFLTPHISTEGMSSWVHRTCTLTWKNKQLFFTIFSEKWTQGRGTRFLLLLLTPSPGWACIIINKQAKEFFHWNKQRRKDEITPWRCISFWNLLPLCITSSSNVQDFALYKGHLETCQWYSSVKAWGEVAFFGSYIDVNLLAEIQKVKGRWKIQAKQHPDFRKYCSSYFFSFPCTWQGHRSYFWTV